MHIPTEKEILAKRKEEELKELLKKDLDTSSLIRLYIIAKIDFDEYGSSLLMTSDDFSLLTRYLKAYGHRQTKLFIEANKVYDDELKERKHL